MQPLQVLQEYAVDEAHCINEWGHDFRPDYTRLGEIRAERGNPTTLALTATATPDVQRDIVRQLALAEADVRLFHEGIDRPNLSLAVIDSWQDDEKLEHILRIRGAHPGTGIVYFTLIKSLMRFSDNEKLRRDQQKLYSLVQYVKHEGDRKTFIHAYFGLPYCPR